MSIKPPDAGNLSNGYYLGWWGGVISATQSVVKATGGMNSVKTPNFRSLSAYERKYVLQWNNYSYRREVWTSIPGLYGYSSIFGGVYINSGYGMALEGWLYCSYPVYGQYPFKALDSRKKALSKIQGDVSRMKVNLAQAFAERRQTTGLIAQSMARLANAALEIRKGHLGNAASILGVPLKKRMPKFIHTPYGTVLPSNNKGMMNLANWWLEFQYGWRPLLSDVKGMAEALAESHLNRKPMRFTGMSSAKTINQKEYVGRRPVGPGWYSDYFATISMVETTRFVLEAREEESFSQVMGSTGVTNPLLLAWELLPYSFVVDWAFPLGNYLQQMEYARGMEFKRGSQSTRRTAVASIRSQVGTDHTGDWWSVRQATDELGANIELIEKTRSILESWPYQDFPSFKPQLGVERALSAISLLTQVFGRGKTSLR